MANPLGLYVHLTVLGGDKAIAWYCSVFGAQIKARHMAEDQHRVMFAILAMFGGHVFLSDVFPELIADTQAPSAAVPPTCTLHIDLEDPNEVNAVVARAQAAGATVTMKPEDVFWGDRYGRIRDPFGHVWSFGARATQPAQT
ncbi:MAG: VOC family protein [Hyphomicrobium sp.]|jgi:PhnB protein|nr:VOC family protein [Hyphomicrobium sp.]